jgi:hypothetical protein
MSRINKKVSQERGRAKDGPHPFIEFAVILEKRLEAGFRAYGDGSFSRRTDGLLEEIQQELLDTCGWSYILWSKVEALRKRLSVKTVTAGRRSKTPKSSSGNDRTVARNSQRRIKEDDE